MASIGKFNIDTAYTSLITTGLNSLANGSAVTSGNVANATNLALLMDLSLMLGSINPSGSPYLEVHILPKAGDGSSFADRSNQTLVGTILVSTGSSAKVAQLIGVPVPPGDFEISLVNQTGVSLAASTNTLYYRLYDYNLNS